MENQEEKQVNKNEGLLWKALGAFAGRSLGNVVLGIIKALVSAVVLAYPLKWLWNDLVGKLALEGVVLLTFGMAFKILLLSAFIFRTNITHTRFINEDVDDEN